MTKMRQWRSYHHLHVIEKLTLDVAASADLALLELVLARAGPAASLRIYYEVVKTTPELFNQTQDQEGAILLGYSFFPKELMGPPPTVWRFFLSLLTCWLWRLTDVCCRWVKTRNLVFQSVLHERGGHFAHARGPRAVGRRHAPYVWQGGPAFGVVPGQTGYAGSYPMIIAPTQHCHELYIVVRSLIILIEWW